MERGRAVVHKMAPFTIRLKDRVVGNSVLQPVELKVDPGSRVTGGAVIRDGKEAVGFYECRHRTGIKDKMDARRAQRRSRRNRRYDAGFRRDSERDLVSILYILKGR